MSLFRWRSVLVVSGVLVSSLLVTSRAALGADSSDVAAADRAWTDALAKNDPTAADKLTDTDFSWTARTGKTHS